MFAQNTELRPISNLPYRTQKGLKTLLNVGVWWSRMQYCPSFIMGGPEQALICVNKPSTASHWLDYDDISQTLKMILSTPCMGISDYAGVSSQVWGRLLAREGCIFGFRLCRKRTSNAYPGAVLSSLRFRHTCFLIWTTGHGGWRTCLRIDWIHASRYACAESPRKRLEGTRSSLSDFVSGCVLLMIHR
jgi:hypothetical protein